LSSSSPVTATTMSGGRSMPARSSVKSSVRVALVHLVLELALELVEAPPRCSIKRHS